MALVLFGNGISDMRGSIAGTVFSKNRYGSYARNRTTPVNPNSARQQAVRNDMASIVNAWFTILTATQREAWNVYAQNVNWTNALGQTITLTGYNHYIRTNIHRKATGMTRVDAGPTVLVLPGTDSEFEVAWSEASQLCTVTFDDALDWCSENSAHMSIHQGVPQNSAKAFYGNHFRLLGVLEGDSASPISSPQTIAVDFPIAETQRDWAFGRIMRRDGRLSEPFRFDALVGA